MYTARTLTLTVIAQDDCIWCDKVKDFLSSVEIPYKELYLEDQPILKAVMKYAKMTVPCVITNETYRLIGGYNETVEWFHGGFATKG